MLEEVEDYHYQCKINEMNQAYFEYTVSAGPLFFAKATAQAATGWYFGVYPSFWMGLAIEGGMDLIIGPMALTIIDPQDKWSGGLDEYAPDVRRLQEEGILPFTFSMGSLG